jgi:hypothetical protein
MAWQGSTNQNLGVSRIADINSYLSEHEHTEDSPIDIFYKTTMDIIRAGTPELLTLNPSLAPLFLVGIISSTENYFRDIFSRIIHICPIAKASSSDQSISFGSVLWHDGVNFERAAFEHISFADSKTIVSNCKKFISYDLKASTMLKEFDKVCELRHGIVHANSLLPGKNAITLQITSRASQTLRIKIDFPQIQECAAICNTLVTAINGELFNEISNRWSSRWIFSDDSTKNESFEKLWKTFYSEIDKARGSIPNDVGMVGCRDAILANS